MQAGDELTQTDSASSVETASTQKRRVPVNCTKAFDSVYYCYSPLHQGRHYYINGELDDCRGRVRRFRMCMMSRFRSQEESEKLYEKAEEQENAKKTYDPVWELRPEFVERIREQEIMERREDDERNKRSEKEMEKWWL